MLDTEWVDSLVLDLLGDDRGLIFVALDDPRHERERGSEECLMSFGSHKNAFSQWLLEEVGRDKEFGVAERLQRSHAKDCLFPSPLHGVDLPIQLAGVELARRTFDAVPVRA